MFQNLMIINLKKDAENVKETVTSWAQVSYFIFIVKVGHYPILSLAYLHLRVLDSFKFYFHILLMMYQCSIIWSRGP